MPIGSDFYKQLQGYQLPGKFDPITMANFGKAKANILERYSPLSLMPDLSILNKYFDIAAGNLGTRQAQATGRAQGTMGAIAGARGYANPGAAILGAGRQAAAPYIQALGGLEEQRAKTLSEQEFRNFQTLLNFLQQQQQFDYQKEKDEAGALDWISALAPLAAAPFSGGTSLLGYLFAPPKIGGGGGTPIPKQYPAG